MAENNTSQQKTEPPSPRKLSEARKKGQVPKSRDLSAALILLAALAAIVMMKDSLVLSLQRLLLDYFRAGMLTGIPDENLPYQLLWFASRAFLVLLPLFAVILVMALVTNVGQVGVLFAPGVLQPRLDRLDPVQGIKRLFSLRSLFELIKNIIKIIVVGVAVYLAVKARLGEILLVYFKTPAQILDAIAGAMLSAAFAGGGAFLAVSLFDLLFQRYEHMKSMRMTKQEVKDELKQTEGDPLVKSWLRRRQREVIVNAIRREVPRATVVITNPTHLAVAVRYDEREMTAPVVTAKGAGDLVQVMKRLAGLHGVPVVENPPVARALYNNVDVGREIPAELYQAMAEIIALVYRLKGKAG